MSFYDCKSLVKKFLQNEYRSSDTNIFLIFSFNILPQKPTITDGLLLVMTTYYHGFSKVLAECDDPYAKELLSRLEEYHAQHPEIEDFTQNKDRLKTHKAINPWMISKKNRTSSALK